MSLIEQALGKREFQERVEGSTTPEQQRHHKRLEIRKGFTTRTTVFLILPLVILIVTGLLLYQRGDSLVSSLPDVKGDSSSQIPVSDSMNTPLLSSEELRENASVPAAQEEVLPAGDITEGGVVKEDLKHEGQLVQETTVKEAVAEKAIVEGTITEKREEVATVVKETRAEKNTPSLLHKAESTAVLPVDTAIEQNVLPSTGGTAETAFSHQNLVSRQYNHALHLERNGKLGQAVLEYERALVLNPGHIKSLNNLGGIYYRLGKFSLALEYYKKALAINPYHVGTYNKMGLALFKLDRVEEAIGVLQQAISKDPDNIESYNNLGVMYKTRGENAMAQATFEHALAIQPNNAELHYNLALLHEAQDNLEPAFWHYQRFIELCPLEYQQLKEQISRHLFVLAKRSVYQDMEQSKKLNNK